MKFYHILIKLVVIIILLSCENNTDGYKSWTVYSGDPTGSKYSDLSEINIKNVGRLKLLWNLEIFDKEERHKDGIQCNPIIVGEKMYVIGPDMKVHSINAKNGELNWSFDPVSYTH